MEFQIWKGKIHVQRRSGEKVTHFCHAHPVSGQHGYEVTNTSKHSALKVVCKTIILQESATLCDNPQGRDDQQQWQWQKVDERVNGNCQLSEEEQHWVDITPTHATRSCQPCYWRLQSQRAGAVHAWGCYCAKGGFGYRILPRKRLL